MDKSSRASRLRIRASVEVGSGRRRTCSGECREETAFPMEKRRTLLQAPASMRGRRTKLTAGRTPGPVEPDPVQVRRRRLRSSEEEPAEGKAQRGVRRAEESRRTRMWTWTAATTPAAETTASLGHDIFTPQPIAALEAPRDQEAPRGTTITIINAHAENKTLIGSSRLLFSFFLIKKF